MYIYIHTLYIHYMYILYTYTARYSYWEMIAWESSRMRSMTSFGIFWICWASKVRYQIELYSGDRQLGKTSGWAQPWVRLGRLRKNHGALSESYMKGNIYIIYMICIMIYIYLHISKFYNLRKYVSIVIIDTQKIVELNGALDMARAACTWRRLRRLDDAVGNERAYAFKIS